MKLWLSLTTLLWIHLMLISLHFPFFVSPAEFANMFTNSGAD